MWHQIMAIILLGFAAVTSFGFSMVPDAQGSADSHYLNLEDELLIPDLLKQETASFPAKERSDARRRTRRAALSLPPNTSVKISLDLSIGVSPLQNTGTYLTLDLPFRFVLPTYDDLVKIYANLGINQQRESSSMNVDVSAVDRFLEEQRANFQRRNIYKHIEVAFKKFGFDGEVCMQRAICELAESPLFGHHGLMAKLIHLIFSPTLLELTEEMNTMLSYDGSISNRIRRDSLGLEERDFLEQPVEDQYTKAYRDGKAKLCWVHYSSCPISILTLLNL